MHSGEATTDIVNLATDLVTAYAGDYRYDEYDGPSLKSALRPPPGRKVLISAHFT